LNFKNKLGIKSKKFPNNLNIKKRYRNYCNNLINLVSETKENFYSTELDNVRGDSRKEWEIVNSLLNRNKSKDDIDCIETKNDKLVDQEKIATVFNEKFTDNSFISHTFNSSWSTTGIDLIDDLTLQNSCYFEPISSYELFNIISSLDNSKSLSHLGNSAFIVKKISLNIVDIFSYICNLCFEKGIFPEALKTAKVIPKYKKGNRKIIDNYRPISILDTFSKIFEKAIKKRMLNFLNRNNFFSGLQFGFREGKSTEDAFLKVVTEIYDGVNSGNKTAAMFIDIKKAFDSVDHVILLKKLHKVGFRGKTFELFQSYLNNRKQFVVIGNKQSDFRLVDLGVPQGSVLGPILFLIYFNSLLHQKFKGNLTAFADDVAITYKVKKK
jgi:hypothetical protein